jgi:hypothetical protein
MHKAVVVEPGGTQSHYTLYSPFEELLAISQERQHIELFVTAREPSWRVRGWPGIKRETSAPQDILCIFKRIPFRNILFDEFVDVDEVTVPLTPEAARSFRRTNMIDESLAQQLSLPYGIICFRAHYVGPSAIEHAAIG